MTVQSPDGRTYYKKYIYDFAGLRVVWKGAAERRLT